MIRWPQTFLEPLAVVAVIVGLVWAYRVVARASPWLGYLLAAGIILRAVGASALFWISYLDLPLLRHLHLGNGYWIFAPDAESYYTTAAFATFHGLKMIPDHIVSPLYVTALSIWMSLVGASPVSGVLLNIVCCVLMCVLSVRLFQGIDARWRQPASLVAVATFSLSPGLVLFGTQTLKDGFFAVLIVIVAVGADAVATALARRPRPAWLVLTVGSGLLLLAVYLAAGVRPYFAFFVWACLGLLFVATLVRAGLRSLAHAAPVAAATLLILWLAFVAGAGPRAARFEALLGLDRLGLSAATLLLEARSSYVQAGGGSSITGPTVRPHEEHDDLVAIHRSWNAGAHLRALSIGAAMLVVPVQLLQALSIVEFEGGRGMLLLTDIDTLLFDVVVVAVIVVLVRGRSAVPANWPYAVFAFTLTLLLAASMAYVVTNYGTLVRLRLMVAISLALLPLTLRAAPRNPGAPLRMEPR